MQLERNMEMLKVLPPYLPPSLTPSLPLYHPLPSYLPNYYQPASAPTSLPSLPLLFTSQVLTLQTSATEKQKEDTKRLKEQEAELLVRKASL